MKIFNHLINSHDIILNQNQHIIIIKTIIRIIIKIKVTEINNFFNKIKIDFAHNSFIKYFMFYQSQIIITMKISSNSTFLQLKIKLH